MRKKILQIILLFAAYTLICMLQKPIFTLFVGGYSFADLLKVMAHGIPMDLSVAGYLTAIPAILALVRLWLPKGTKSRNLNIIIYAYFIFSTLLLATCCITNAALYPVWNFPLDATPIFYVTSSPTAAMASESYWVWAAGLVLMILLACLYTWICVWAYYKLPNRLTPRNHEPMSRRRQWSTSLVILILTALLIIPIRGGVTVSTMNVGRAYFSENPKLNHAAVNPVFSLMYSLMHQRNFGKDFRFMADEQAHDIITSLRADANYQDSLNIAPPTKVQIIILESFSSHLMPSLGGEPIAMRLDSIAQEGLLFTNIYSSSFRTDRALPAILNGYPAQPTTSMVKYVRLFSGLPSLARNMHRERYETSYYYGGDINYCNFRALLTAGDYHTIICDNDFPINKRLSKWGAHDDELFRRVYADAKAADPLQREFSVVQTSSSHEPFEVPYQGPSHDIRINSFMFADSVLGNYVDSLKTLPSYDNTLLVIVPDHFGTYPLATDLTDHRERHRIPLVFAGGYAQKLKVDPSLLQRIGSQTDIAATVLALAGAKHSDFLFSNNLLDPKRKEFAYFSEPTWIAMVTPDGMADITVETNGKSSEAPDSVYTLLKAYVQELYNDLDRRMPADYGVFD